ncbi:hypothetical protein HDU76_003177 [Blyttiomyces sp. JEL0837]|nr:hypothetical protein HDU76_003177 [Blyttiomyces sp. JEL0837]
MIEDMPSSSSSMRDASPEITSSIIKSSDPFTRFINNDLTREEIDQYGNEVWKTAFDIDYDGDLAKFPQNHFPTFNNGLKNVKSRAMYHRLCKLKPALAKWKIVKNIFIDQSAATCSYYQIECGCLMPRTVCVMDQLLVYIPIFNGWTDELPKWWNECNPAGPFKIACKIGHLEMVKDLLLRRSEFPKQEDPVAIFGKMKEDALETGFTMAAGAGYLDIVKLLLEMEDGVYYFCQSGGSMADAARNGHLEVVAYLMDYYKKAPGPLQTVFGIACDNGQTDVVKLLNTWVKVDYMTDREKSVNMVDAVKSGKIDLVRYLVEEAGFNDAVSCGEAFLIAVRIGFDEAVAILVKVEGVDIAHGRELALECRRPEISKMLSEIDVKAG